MTNNVLLQVPARKVGATVPGVLAVGAAEIEILSELTATAGTASKRFAVRWTKGASHGNATIDLRPASKTTTELKVSLERPKGAQAFLWPKATLRRLEELLGQALAYEIETRSVEEASAFGTRRTSRDLVKARAS
jgi:hypothetical protein